jgi:pimeloyl-ACP methyl ester carboxylesterase
MVIRRRSGEAGRPPLLLVHGLGESSLCFEGLLAETRLAPWERLAPDLPGYGRSPWPREPPGLSACADLLERWLEEQGQGPVVLVGHSMGGVLALFLAERHPRRVSGLVDVDGTICLDDCNFSSQAARYTLEAFESGGFDTMREEVGRRGVTEPALRSYHVSMRLAQPASYHRHALELLEASRPADLARRLAALPVPVVYIAGVPDGVSSRSRELLREAGVPCEEVGPAGHWPFLDQPALFTTTLLHQLARMSPV